MQKKTFLAAILAMALVFGMTIIGCDNGTTNEGGGYITITGIPATYNGKLAGFKGNLETHPILVGAASVKNQAGRFTLTPVQISGGRVTLPAWKITDDDVVQRFSGNATTYGELTILAIGAANLDLISIHLWENVVFIDGNVILPWASGEPWVDIN